MFGIICAMDIELQGILSELKNVKTEYHAKQPYYIGKYNEKDVVICNCGVGKVNAGMHTQALIDFYHPDKIIQSGVAGALSPEVKQFDIVLATEATYHDMQDFIVTDTFNLQRFYPTDKNMVEKFKNILPNCHVGRVATGDWFVNTNEDKKRIYDYTNALCTEMEGCAVAQTCLLNEIPFIIIRSISDCADGNADVDFPTFVQQASERTKSAILKFIEE